ncbi:DUF411 domain-containing protein [Ancylobacter dichloromethanicus]
MRRLGRPRREGRLSHDDRRGAQDERNQSSLWDPSALWSCHTAEVESYLLEGHVPATALIRLLAARPSVRGIAVAGMPVGSPGMDVAGMEPETYDVMAFGSETPNLFMRFRGASPIPS